jgi:LDH2 family malate/lactate/ureidoglycolate dehydrogenase
MQIILYALLYPLLTVDGDNGLGLVVAPKANDMAIERAKKYGCGAVGIRNTNHFGIAAYYTLQAADKGCIGTAMTNSTPLVAAHGGRGRVLGTNPLAATFPAHRKEDRVTVDMASSAVAYGKVEIKNRSKQGIPWGWAIDKGW